MTDEMKLNPAAGGNPIITSPTLEGAIFQMLEFLQDAESIPEINTSSVNRTTSTMNMDALTYSGSFSLQADVVLNASGVLSLSPIDYLTIPDWSAGDGSGSLKSATWSGQLLELVALFIAGQNNASLNPGGEKWLEPDYDFTNKTISCIVRALPLERVKTVGGWSYTAAEVLND